MTISIMWVLFAATVAAAAVTDVRTYRIPNAIVLVLLGLFAVAAGYAVYRHMPVSWVNHLSAGLLSLVVGLVLYGTRQMGAGDVKLLAALALWAGLPALPFLLFWIAVCSLGVLAIMLAAPLMMSRRALYQPAGASLPRALRKGEGVPYGLGIALGAIVASTHFQPWLWKI